MAGENYHHGPEVIRLQGESGVVTDSKMAVVLLVGTAPIHVAHSVVADRAAYIQQPIIIRRRAEAIAAFGDPAEAAGYSIPEALHAAFNKDEGQGVGTYVVVNVFDPATHATGGTPDPTRVTSADIIGGINAGGVRTGLELAYVCYNRFGFFPRQILAPRFDGVVGVRQKMLEVANNVKGRAIIDLTAATVQGAITARGTAQPFAIASNRVALCFPKLLALDPVTGGQSLQPYSQHFAGLWNRVMASRGPQESPSNLPMSDVSGTEIDIAYMPGRYDTDTNLLNENGIVTTMTRYGQGIHSWGASSASWPTVKDTEAWLHGQVVLDAIDDAVLFYLLPYTDRGAILRRLSMIEERVNKYLATKSGANDEFAWLYGGTFYFDRQKTTAESIIGSGQIFWKLERQPVGIMHRATIQASTNLAFVESALNLVAA